MKSLPAKDRRANHWATPPTLDATRNAGQLYRKWKRVVGYTRWELCLHTRFIELEATCWHFTNVVADLFFAVSSHSRDITTFTLPVIAEIPHILFLITAVIPADILRFYRAIHYRVTLKSIITKLRSITKPGQLSFLPSVGRGMSSISVARWMKLLAAMSPSNECLYEGKADVVYLQVTLCDPHLSA